MTRSAAKCPRAAVHAVAIAALGVASVARGESGFVHPRRVAIEIDGRREPGLLLDADTAWSSAPDAARARRVCAGERCASVVTPEPCEDARCPMPGKRLVLDRPIAGVSDWPDDDDDEQSLVTELRRDDVLAPLLSERGDGRTPITWGIRRFLPPDPPDPPFFWETAASAAGMALHDEGRLAFGAELAIGASTSFDYSRPSDWAFGNSWGVSARFGAYAGPARYVGALGLDNQNIVGAFDRSRVRVPALIGVVVPEVGLLFAPNATAAPLLRWRLPFDVLLTRTLAVDVRPTFGIAYPTSGRAPNWMLGLSVGALVRAP